MDFPAVTDYTVERLSAIDNAKIITDVDVTDHKLIVKAGDTNAFVVEATDYPNELLVFTTVNDRTFATRWNPYEETITEVIDRRTIGWLIEIATKG